MVYLDYNATTPTDKRVIESMLPVFSEKFGNPSSENYSTGMIARELVENARKSVAGVVGMKPSDVIFTSGATEANNMAFTGILDADITIRVLVSAIEHKSVLETCRFMLNDKIDATMMPVDKDGVLDMDTFEKMVGDNIDLVSVMAANSETGVIQPIKDIVKIAHKHDATVHCDATQAIGKIPFNAGELDIDMVTFSSHKIYGPKGCGALVANKDARFQLHSFLHGGGQENNIRSGTLNVPGIVGFGKACEIVNEQLQDASRQAILRDDFEERITSVIPGVTINSKNADRLPNTSNIRIEGTFADAVIVNAREIEIASGSACSSSTMAPSHVLTAMGLSIDEANESIRISIGRHTTKRDIDIAVDSIMHAVQFVRGTESKVMRGGE